MANQIKRALASDEKGSTMLEYSMMAAMIALVSIVAITWVGGNVRCTFDTVKGAVRTSADPGGQFAPSTCNANNNGITSTAPSGWF